MRKVTAADIKLAVAWANYEVGFQEICIQKKMGTASVYLFLVMALREYVRRNNK